MVTKLKYEWNNLTTNLLIEYQNSDKTDYYHHLIYLEPLSISTTEVASRESTVTDTVTDTVGDPVTDTVTDNLLRLSLKSVGKDEVQGTNEVQGANEVQGNKATTPNGFYGHQGYKR